MCVLLRYYCKRSVNTRAQSSFVNDGLFTELCKFATDHLGKPFWSKQVNLLHHILHVTFLFNLLRMQSARRFIYLLHLPKNHLSLHPQAHKNLSIIISI